MTTVAIWIDLEHAIPLPVIFSDWRNIWTEWTNSFDNSNLADLAILKPTHTAHWGLKQRLKKAGDMKHPILVLLLKCRSKFSVLVGSIQYIRVFQQQHSPASSWKFNTTNPPVLVGKRYVAKCVWTSSLEKHPPRPSDRAPDRTWVWSDP